MARPIDTIHPKYQRSTRAASLPAADTRLDSTTAARPRRSANTGLWLLVLLIGGFFLMTRPATDADTTASSTPVVPVATAKPSETRLGPPQPSQSASLEETVILDAPLPTSREQTAPSQSSPVTSSETPPSGPTSYTVRILNGTTTSGLAARYQDTLKAKGVSVSAIGTAVSRYERSIVYFTAGHRSQAEEIVTALGWSSVAVEEDQVAKPADVLVVIGNDHAR